MPTGIYYRSPQRLKELTNQILQNASKRGYWLGKKRPPPTKEWKQKISLAMKGRIPKGAGWNRGKTLSEEHKRKLSVSHKGKKLSEKHKINLSLALMGRTLSIDTRIKLQGRIPWNKGKKGLYQTSEETRKKLSISCSGKEISEEHRQ